LAEKKVKHWDPVAQKTVSAEKNNGVKFELFYFDVFEETNKIGLFETLREEEFAPLKNATGEDSPQSARDYLKKLHRKWVEAAGVALEGEGDVEIHPRVSYNGEEIDQWVEGTFGELKAKLPLYIE
jgi:UDP-N-acetylglucosamine/UDP-N-acetylgalactosamine diphosphorylase